MALMARIGNVIATLVGGPGVAVIGDPGEPAPGRAPRFLAIAIVLIVVLFALSMVWSRP